MNDSSDHKKPKGTKTCVIKQKFMFENYKECLFNNKTYIHHRKDLKSITMLCTQKK